MAIQTNRSIDGGFTQVSKTGTTPAFAEGAFTPTLVAYGGSPTTQPEFSFETAFGRYQRIGNKVIVDVDFYGDNCNVQGVGNLAIGVTLNVPGPIPQLEVVGLLSTAIGTHLELVGIQLDLNQGEVVQLSADTPGKAGTLLRVGCLALLLLGVGLNAYIPLLAERLQDHRRQPLLRYWCLCAGSW